MVFYKENKRYEKIVSYFVENGITKVRLQGGNEKVLSESQLKKIVVCEQPCDYIEGNDYYIFCADNIIRKTTFIVKDNFYFFEDDNHLQHTIVDTKNISQNLNDIFPSHLMKYFDSEIYDYSEYSVKSIRKSRCFLFYNGRVQKFHFASKNIDTSTVYINNQLTGLIGVKEDMFHLIKNNPIDFLSPQCLELLTRQNIAYCSSVD